MHFSKVTVLGPGLLGGSIALGLRERFPATRVAIWARRVEAAEEAARLGDLATTDLTAAVAEADLVVLCVPIGAMQPLALKIVGLLKRGALVTDVGSVKAPVVASLTAIFQGGQFIGSHPMAGSEQTGMAAAQADLFQGAPCMITPQETNAADDVRRVRQFWEGLGCQVHLLPAEEHDALVAANSHLPHLLAAALAHFAAAEHPRALDLAGPGFRDSTRIAAGPPAMWAEIFHENRKPLQKSAQAMIEKLSGLLKLLDASDTCAMEQFLTEAKARRDKLSARNKR